MAQLLAQPSRCFFDVLQTELRRVRWSAFDAAVAWVRQAGLRHLLPDLVAFLHRGGRARFIVGISFQQTTWEALSDLLALEAIGGCETWIYHNEAGPVFHPKLYLFRDAQEGRILAGSNNVTEGGLFTNVECALGVRVAVNSRVMADAVREFNGWLADNQLSKRLDAALLGDLLARGYITNEAAVPRLGNRPGGAGIGGGRAQRLFGSRRNAAPAPPARPVPGVPPPTPPAGSPGAAPPRPTGAPTGRGRGISPPPGAVTNVLIMRVRPSRGHVQVQIPFRLARTGYMTVGMRVISSHDQRGHGISRAQARGKANTLKLEIPEVQTFRDPVVEFIRTRGRITYAAYDAAVGGTGRTIRRSLQAGMATGHTQVTVPSSPLTSTWWRFM